MEASSPTGEPSRRSPKALTYEELVELAKLFLSDPTNRSVEEEFAAGCLAQITKFVKAYASWKFFPDSMVDDAISLAQLNWVRGIRGLRSPEDLNKWLIRVSRNAAVTEFLRTVIGKAIEERKSVPLETQDVEGKITETLDLRESREGAQRYGAAASSSLEDFRGNVEKQKVLGKVLEIHMRRAKTKRDRDSALWIQVLLLEGINVGDPIDEITKRRGTTRADVTHLFKHDGRALYGIYQELAGVS